MGSGIVAEGTQPIGSTRDFLDQHPLSSLLRCDDGTHACIELEMEVGFLEEQVKFTRPNLVSVWWVLARQAPASRAARISMYRRAALWGSRESYLKII